MGMNKRQHDFFYPQLVRIYGGEFCRGCGKNAFDTTEKKMLIDHIDNDDRHNVFSNLQFLCRTCNRIKNPSKQIIPDKPMTFSEWKNLKGEPRFRNWLFNYVMENEKIEYDQAIDSGAELCELSTETIKRYMRKCLSDKGIYDYIEGFVCFKGSSMTVEEEIIKSRV